MWSRPIRLGLLAGAIFLVSATAARGQIIPPTAGETPIPPKPKTDSAEADSARIRADTLRAPIGRFADPVTYEIGPAYQWNRQQLLASGALTLGDLLERIPQLNVLRSGWLATPQTASFNGNFRRVRVFYDGIELDNLDPATGGLLDLSTVQLWTLENVAIERTAGEARIHLRSWRVDNTIPYTRVEVTTGNEDTNLYRGYYGKRYGRGQALQVAAQQYGVRSSRLAGSGDALSLLTRIGMARKHWSVDGFLNRTHARRDTQRPTIGRPVIPSVDQTHTTAYVRAGFGGVNSGPRAQIVAASLKWKGSKIVTSQDTTGTTVTDTVPATVSEAQYTVGAGYTAGPLRVEVQNRVRSIDGSTFNSLSGRLDFVTRFAVLSGLAEKDGFRRITNADVGIRVQPLPFVALSGSVSQIVPAGNSLFTEGRFARAEIGVKVLRPWVSVGVITRDTATTLPPVIYDTLFQPAALGRARGSTGAIRGPLGRGFGVDAFLTRWERTESYQPQYQGRAEVNFASNFIRRFPKGDFELRAATVYEYRGHNLFPLPADELRVMAAKTFSALIEIRIMRGIISYQQRNIMGFQHEILPGFEMPRVLAIYGVRWEFWN